MKIVFNIQRARWLRLISATIDAALKTNGEVILLLHSYQDVLNMNNASVSILPEFSNGLPQTYNLGEQEGFFTFLKQEQPDVIVDILPPEPAIARRLMNLEKRPFWVVQDGNPLNCGIYFKDHIQLYCTDLFFVKTPLHIEKIVKKNSQNLTDILSNIDSEKYFINKRFIDHLKDSLQYTWEKEHVDCFLNKAVVVGSPTLDDLSRVDRKKVIKDLNIPSGKKIVTLLYNPYGSNVSWKCLWEQLFICRNYFEKAFRRIKCAKFKGLVSDFTNKVYGDFLRSLSVFCKKNNAVLVLKVKPNVAIEKIYEPYVDVVVGDGNYHPSSSISLYSISDIVIGFYSTGAIEAVAAGAYYLNIDIPYCPLHLYEKLQPVFEKLYDYNGVSSSVDVNRFVEKFPEATFDDFIIDQKMREVFLEDHVGSLDGNSSDRLIEKVMTLSNTGI